MERPGRGQVAAKQRRQGAEVLLVLGVSLGYSAVWAIVELAGKLSAGKALSAQTSTLNPSEASGRPVLDLAFQLVRVFFGLVPAFLALHLLNQDDRSDPAGLRTRRIRFDAGWGVALAAAIGIPGLARVPTSAFFSVTRPSNGATICA